MIWAGTKILTKNPSNVQTKGKFFTGPIRTNSRFVMKQFGLKIYCVNPSDLRLRNLNADMDRLPGHKKGQIWP